MNSNAAPDLILHNGQITTLDPQYPEARNLAIKDGRVVGVDDAEAYGTGPNTRVIDLKGRRVIPGLNDSHLHVIRAGLYYNMELRWDGVPSLADAMRMLKEQAQRTPPPHWVRVIGGWNEWQFRRETDAHAGRTEPSRAGNAGHGVASLRQRDAQSRRAPRTWNE